MSDGTRTWKANPVNGDLNDPRNWDVVGDGSLAVFDTSAITELTFLSPASPPANPPKAITFTATSDAYTFTVKEADLALTISGTVQNLGTHVQQFIAQCHSTGIDNPQILFSGTATAGGPNIQYEATFGGDKKGGAVILFSGNSSADSAHFVVRTGADTKKGDSGTVGGEVGFTGAATAAQATFEVYGTLGTDGDSFGNAAFHENSGASSALFTNYGGTVPKGDGGNTQFYDASSAQNGRFENLGATVAEANGGDVAFDGNSKAGQGVFNQHPAAAVGGYGGVVSFNNNYPYTPTGGASAESGTFNNYGATDSTQGGGGHTEFTARYGSPYGDQGTFNNFSSNQSTPSTAGHTILSVSGDDSAYEVHAGDATFNNYGGVSPGYTQLVVWNGSNSGTFKVFADRATFNNLGAPTAGQQGGKTLFGTGSSADYATLIASGSIEGAGGRIVFEGDAVGAHATVQLGGTGVLDVSGASASVAFDQLDISGGSVHVGVGTQTVGIEPASVSLQSGAQLILQIVALEGLTTNTAYKITGPLGLQQADVKVIAPALFQANWWLDGGVWVTLEVLERT